MRINRLKRAHANLAFYRNHFQFRAPYHLLVDGTFCAVIIKRKQNFEDQLKKYLGDKSILFTTACVIREMEKLGSSLLEATKMAKDFKIQSCPHMEKPIAAANCIHSIIANRSESEHFIVCTQDRQLVNKLQKIPGCPVLFFKMNAIHLDKPTQASRQKSKEQIKEQLIGKDELEKLKKLKEENQISTTSESSRKKRKVAKGPNPNSCRKRKSFSSHQDTTEESNNKRKRKRDRQKVSKHIRTLLDENKVDV